MGDPKQHADVLQLHISPMTGQCEHKRNEHDASRANVASHCILDAAAGARIIGARKIIDQTSNEIRLQYAVGVKSNCLVKL